MFCKKCGTEQKDGQKFCPKCGEPFLDENGRPYLKGFKKDMQDAKDKLASKADELTKQSKKLIDEKVQPHLNEKIDELKKVDWEGKKNDSLKTMKGFFSNVDKLRKATIWIAIIAVLWFFIFNDGFSASWAWWVVAIMVVGAAFLKVNSLKETRELFAATLFLGICLVFYSPSESDSSSTHLIDDDTEIAEDSESSNSVPESEIRFSNEMNVITYLTSRIFRDSKGNTLRFSGGNCELEMNNVSISPYTEIISITSNSATLRMHGPYGNATLKLYVSGSKGVIQDRDGSEYYSTR